MVPVILSWIYIVFIFFVLGLFCFRLIHAVTGSNSETSSPHITLVLVAGIIATSVLASGMSLFMPIGLAANLVLLAISVCILFFFRRTFLAYLPACRKALRSTHWLLVLLFTGYSLILAYLSAELPSHHDNGLYYATTMQWIQQYGLVKGLANVNPRIGFNSNWHVLQALFSFPFLHEGYLSNINGLLLLMVFPYSLCGLARLWKRDYSLPVILRSVMFIPLIAFHFGPSSEYIFFNMNFISSPVADLAVCVLTWLVLVLFIEMDGRAGVAYNSRALLILMMAVFMFTIKPSAAPVLLAGIFLFMAMALRRQWRAVFFACAAAFMIAVPWLARNVTITGYLLFPFEGIDMFAVDWKLPLEHVRWHANAVKSYAADPGYDLNKPFALGFTDWFPGWFRRLVFIQVTMLVAALMSMVVCLGVLARGLVQSGRLFVRVHLHTIFAVVIMASGMAFWLLKGPDFRLGYGFIGLLAMLLPALLLQRFLRSGLRYAGFPFAGIMFFILVYHYKEIWKNMPAMMFRGLPALRMPETMERVNVGKGVQMNLVLREDSWYAPLPVANNNEFYSILPVPRGAGIAEGFRSAQKRSLP